MKSSWGVRPLTTAVAAFCLTLPLWLGACVPLEQNAYDAGPSPAVAPEPRPAPPVSPPEEAGAPTATGSSLEPGRGASGQGAPGAGATGQGTAGGLSEPVPSAGSAAPSGDPNPGGSGPGGLPSAGVAGPDAGPDTQAQLPGSGQQPAPASGAAAGPAAAVPTTGSTPTASTAPGSPGTGTGEAGAGTAVYYVALDDGGRSGVRFGCNDSLVAVHQADSSASEPLQAAMGRLLSGPGAPPATGLYNALSASSLQYVSGYLDGTTVVVNLTGAVQPGGVCDLPRIEAQLTHTAVTAVGAVRAEIYVSGVPLAEVLGLR
ncbi:GerMN domain-containing protein [Arthrobacter sp. SAFR-014]|uniref:GerMN domain-containing protein n=1 Tax=unclassified Arthrobacter TaxID=235627 RepID=UPI003F7B5AD2